MTVSTGNKCGEQSSEVSSTRKTESKCTEIGVVESMRHKICRRRRYDMKSNYDA
jgi:hypothetical protein